MDNAVDLRRELHRHPDLSGDESQTAQRIVHYFDALQPDRVIRGLGGTGVAFVFSGRGPGPTVLLRCELDALPIDEAGSLPHQSATPGVSHKCGHDGHMAVLAAVGTALAAQRPARGRVVLLYQPAEETGAGATAVANDPKFADIRPDFAFALHNVPGFVSGKIVVRDGVFSCASRGMVVRLSGATAHAAQPETGKSPARAMCRIVDALTELPVDIAPPHRVVMSTVVGARLGDKAFGTAPGQADVWITLRGETDEDMAALIAYAENVVRRHAEADGVQHEITYEDVFAATVNTPRAVQILREAAASDAVLVADQPFRWSEDFGVFTALAEGAMFGLGAGTATPDLHNADYDFPDELIPVAARIFGRIIDGCLAR